MKAAFIPLLFKTTFIVCLSLQLMSIKAQTPVTFAIPGAEWSYLFYDRYSPPPYLWTAKISYLSETVIGTDTIKTLSNHYTNKSDNSCELVSNTDIKQKADTIWFRNNMTNGTWQILYNFATPVGQTWSTKIYHTNAPASVYTVYVDSVRTVTINNVSLKQLSVHYFGGTYGVESTRVTERLGCELFMYNYYTHECATDQPWFQEFLCYKDPLIGTYQHGSKPCDYTQTIGVKELGEKSSSVIYHVNRATHELIIKSAETLKTLYIYDINGRPILQQRIENNTIVVNINDFTAGIYVVKILTADGLHYKKINVIK